MNVDWARYFRHRITAGNAGNEDSAADLLQETLDEEGAADEKATTLAETVINAEGVAPAAGRSVLAVTTHDLVLFAQRRSDDESTDS